MLTGTVADCKRGHCESPYPSRFGYGGGLRADHTRSSRPLADCLATTLISSVLHFHTVEHCDSERKYLFFNLTKLPLRISATENSGAFMDNHEIPPAL